MTDRYESERARRLAIVVSAERQIAKATRAAYAELLAAVASDIRNEPVVAAFTAPATVQAKWAKLQPGIFEPILALFNSRFQATGASAASLQAASTAFEAKMAANLHGVPEEVYADLDAIQKLGTQQNWLGTQIREAMLAEVTPGTVAYEARLTSVANRVARTSAIAAFNAGDYEGFQALNLPKKHKATKRWLSSHDSHVRPTHVDADDDPENQAVPVDGFFQVGGFQGLYPGDPALPPEETVNCRCTALYTDGSLEVMTPITAAGGHPRDPISGKKLPNGWRGPIAALDKPTGDKRMLMTPKDGIRTRQYPLTMTQNHVGDPTGYPPVGAIDRAWSQDGLLYAEGPFDLGAEPGQNASRQLANGIMNTVSIDPDMVEAEVHSYDKDGALIGKAQLSASHAAQFAHSGTPFSDGNWYFAEVEAEDDAPSLVSDDVASQILAFTNWRLAGLAHVPIPAYTEARIEPVWDYEPGDPSVEDAIVADGGKDKFSDRDIQFLDALHKHLSVHHTRLQISQNYLSDSKASSGAVKDLAKTIIKNQTSELADIDTLIYAAGKKSIVAAVGGQVFNAKFFGDPQFTEHTPLTIDENGHVYGHVRQHGTCYQYGGGKGNGGFCLEPPDSACGYAKFEQHRAKLDDGRTIHVGALTFGDGHTSAGSLMASQKHYNDVSSIAAKVNAGTDIFGVWVNGQVTSAYEDQAYDLLLSPMSGHWEPDADNNGHLEMIAVHIVVTPGYTARTIVAGFDEAGQPNSLIITTYPERKEEPEMSQAEIVAAVRAELARQRRAAELMAKIGSNVVDPLYALPVVAGAGGSVDLPVASTSTAWDGGAAAGRMLDRATKNGKIDVGVAAKGFLWHDGDGSKRGDYKFPFADVQSGVLTIIPRGVSAAAGRLNQAKGVDTTALRAKINSLYKKIHAADSSWPASAPE